MHTRFEEDEGTRALMERRWFALHRAAGRLRHECEVLAGVMQATQDDWREAHSQLREIEATRDALGEELARLDGARPAPAALPARAMGSAA